MGALPPLLYQDEALLAINKPAGLRTLPDGYDRSAEHVKSLLEPAYGRLWIVHRLDKDTSGVLLIARNAAAHKALNTQFDRRSASKIYHALLIGAPPWKTITLDAPLKPDGDRHHRTVPHPQGKPAATHVRVLEPLGDYTLIEAAPQTGRTHQIRAHLWAAGFPLAADSLYAGRDKLIVAGQVVLARCALHARSLELIHPVSAQPLRLEAPYPPDFSTALEHLRQAFGVSAQISGAQVVLDETNCG